MPAYFLDLENKISAWLGLASTDVPRWEPPDDWTRYTPAPQLPRSWDKANKKNTPETFEPGCLINIALRTKVLRETTGIFDAKETPTIYGPVHQVTDGDSRGALFPQGCLCADLLAQQHGVKEQGSG